jgi:TolB-like protein/Flp pilus assembly protein TadD
MGGPSGRLDSWKEIAAYLRRGARTVQRWEAEEGLPVHRLQHEKLGSVYAFPAELDAWWENRRARLENAPAVSARDVPSVAVLPFADLTREKDQGYFCEGIADEILAALGGLSGIHVASRSASFRFRTGVDDPRETARRLRVSRLLEGSVRRSGGRLRISVHLTAVESGFQVWSSRFDRDERDIFAIQEEIAAQVAAAMSVSLSAEERASLRRKSTANPQAYDCYLRGRKHYSSFGPQDAEFARQLFEKATRLDPQFALAYAGLADCYSYAYLHSRRTPELLAQAREAAARAVDLDPESAETHLARAVAWSLSGLTADVDREFETALELNPRLFEAHYYYARHLFMNGRQPEAVAQYEQAMRVNPEDYQAPLLVAQSYDDLGRPEDGRQARLEGIRLAEAHLAFHPDDTRAMYMAANGMVALGQRERGLELAARARQLRPGDGMLLYNLACIYAMAGCAADALDCLECAAAAGVAPLEWIRHDSNLKSLHGEPRYEALAAGR